MLFTCTSAWIRSAARSWISLCCALAALAQSGPTTAAGQSQEQPQSRSVITVISGEVHLANEHGELVLQANERGIMELGKAPFKLVLTNPADRVQWIVAASAEPLRHIRMSTLLGKAERAAETLGID